MCSLSWRLAALDADEVLVLSLLLVHSVVTLFLFLMSIFVQTSEQCFLSSGASIGDGQSAVASNIANTTYRLQWWDFTKFDLPEISNGTVYTGSFCCCSVFI